MQRIDAQTQKRRTANGIQRFGEDESLIFLSRPYKVLLVSMASASRRPKSAGWMYPTSRAISSAVWTSANEAHAVSRYRRYSRLPRRVLPSAIFSGTL